VHDSVDQSSYNKSTSCHKFPTVQILSNKFEVDGIELLDREVVIEVVETYFDKKKGSEE
jgi:hypothetical protein